MLKAEFVTLVSLKSPVGQTLESSRDSDDRPVPVGVPVAEMWEGELVVGRRRQEERRPDGTFLS